MPRASNHVHRLGNGRVLPPLARSIRERWEAMFLQRYERDTIEKNDTHFYVGNIHQHPDNWLIVGLFYPPMPAIGDLFDA